MPELRFLCQSRGCYICTYFSDPVYEKSILNRCVFNFWQLHLFLLHFPSYFFIIVLTDHCKGVFYYVLILLTLPLLFSSHFLYLLHFFKTFLSFFFFVIQQGQGNPSFGLWCSNWWRCFYFPSLSGDIVRP